MKKIVLLLVFVMASLTCAWSQLSVGAKAGLNLANETFSGGNFTTSPDFRVGLHLGAYAHLRFGHFGLQPEVLYSMQGAKSGSSTIKTAYFNVPILFRFNITDFFNIHAGPQFGVLLSAKQTNGSATLDLKGDFETVDISGCLGAGVDLPMGISAGVRGVVGLSNIEKNLPNGTSVKNYVIQLYVGYRLFGK